MISPLAALLQAMDEKGKGNSWLCVIIKRAIEIEAGDSDTLSSPTLEKRYQERYGLTDEELRMMALHYAARPAARGDREA
jgi:hypothetical protein